MNILKVVLFAFASYKANLSIAQRPTEQLLIQIRIIFLLACLSVSLIDVRGCRHSGFRHSGFSPRGLDVRGSDVRGRLFRTLGFRTFGVFENGRSGLNPERLKLNAVSLNPERPKTPNVRK